MKKLKLLLVVFVVAVIVPSWLIHLRNGPSDIGLGGPLEIRLVGVRPDAGEKLFDINGKEIEGLKIPSLVYGGWWGSENLRREFIFELPTELVTVHVGHVCIRNDEIRAHAVEELQCRLPRLSCGHSETGLPQGDLKHTETLCVSVHKQ